MLFYDTYVFAHIKILCETFYNTYPCTYFFDKPFQCYILYIYTHFLEGFFCYLLTNTHILKNTFTLPIQHFVRHFMLYIFIFMQGIFMLFIFCKAFYSTFCKAFYSTFCKAFPCYIYLHIYIPLKGIFHAT